jgi:hypothetical protein
MLFQELGGLGRVGMKRVFLFFGLGLIALSGVLFADIPYFWLDHPSGRTNPNDPKSPSYKPPTPVIAPYYSPTSTPTQSPVVSPTSTPTASLTYSPAPTNVSTWPATPTPACQLPSSAVGHSVLGQSGFGTGAVNGPGLGAGSMAGPEGICVAGGRLYVADRDNHRILIWNSPPTAMDQPADVVLGQTNLYSNNPSVSANGLSGPAGIASDGVHLVVADAFNNRVLIWNSLPSSNGQAADIVLGQPNFSTNVLNYGGRSARSFNTPFSVVIVQGKLIVADANNHRVLIWNSLPFANYTPADYVLGQSAFTLGSPTGGAAGLNDPIGLGSDGTDLMIGDLGNNRLIIHNTVPTSSNAPADLVLGQPSFTSYGANTGGLSAASMNQPWEGFVHGGSLYVTDVYNQRVLVWNSMPSASGAPADRVLGQPNMVTVAIGAGVGQFYYPVGLSAFGDELYVTEWGNNRVQLFNCQNQPTSTVSPTISPTFSISPTWSTSMTATISPTVSSTRTSTPSRTVTASPTTTPAPPPLVLAGCASDSVAGVPPTGVLTVPQGTAFIPLCDGWVLIEDQVLNQIRAVWAPSGAVGATYQLDGAPQYLAYDAAAGILYATKSSSATVSRVNLAGGSVSNLTFTSTVSDVAVAPSGRLFVVLGTYSNNLLLADGSSGSVLWTGSTSVSAGLLAYDGVHQRLFVTEGSGSPGDVEAWAYAPATPSLTKAQTLSFSISTVYGRGTNVSPDGSHVSVNIESISDLHYSGWSDVDSLDLYHRKGKWPAGARAFSPDSKQALGTDGNYMSVSDVGRHLTQQQVSSSSWAPIVWDASFSRGGAIAYGLYGLYSGNAELHWMLAPAELSPTPVPSGLPLSTFNCSTDSTGPLPANGSLTLAGAPRDFAPLCSGALIVEEDVSNSVQVLDASGAAQARYYLPAAPGRMALDGAQGKLYVACDSSDDLQKIDLVSGTLSSIRLSRPAFDVELAGGNTAFVSLDGGNPKVVSVVDVGADSETAVQSCQSYEAQDLRFDPASSRLYLFGQDDWSYRMLYSAAGQTLTQQESNYNQVSYGDLDPSGSRLVLGYGTGNYPYTELTATNFAVSLGSYNGAAYYGACAYSPDGATLVLGYGGNLTACSTATRAAFKTIPAGGSTWDNMIATHFSRGGGLVYGLDQNQLGGPYKLFWGKIP